MTAPALILIDIQNDYFPGGQMALHRPSDAAAQTARLLALFRERDWPRIHIQHESVRSDAGFLIRGTDGQAIHATVAPRADEPVIVKHFPNAFQDTGLDEHLRALHAQRLVITGMMTHMCVDTSVRAAFERGYRVQLIADATATRALRFAGLEVPADEVQAAFLAAMNGVFSQVLTADDWLAGTTGEARPASG